MSAAVVKLPTAASRKVQQQQNRAGCAARAAFREAQGRTFPYMLPCEREAAPLADFMEANPLTPERRILLVLIQALDLDHDAKLKLALGTVADPVAHKIVELAFADARTTHNIQSVLRRRGSI